MEVSSASASIRRISIDDYPEHLNPFYEDDHHKNIRFWAVTKKKLRSNSFSFSGFDEKVKALRFSFRNKSRKTNTDTDSSDKRENEIPTKEEFLKNCNSGRYVYKGSETPVLTLKTYTTDQSERRRFGFSTLSRLPATSTPKKSAPLRPNTLNGSENINHNPFEKSCHLSPILNRTVESKMSLTRRKKRQAPLPPISSAFQSIPAISANHLEDNDSAINMTDEIFNIELQITETDLEITEDSGIETDKCQITQNSSVLSKNEKDPVQIDKFDENYGKINVIKTEKDVEEINLHKSSEKDEINIIEERKEYYDGSIQIEGKQFENKEHINECKSEIDDKTTNINDSLLIKEEINVNECVDNNMENEDCVKDEINVTETEKNYIRIEIDKNSITDENLQINEEINKEEILVIESDKDDTDIDKNNIIEIKDDENFDIKNDINTSIAIENIECSDTNNNENIKELSKIEQDNQFLIEDHQDIVFIDGSNEENIQNPNNQIKVNTLEKNDNSCNNKVNNMKKIFEKKNNDIFVFNNNESKNKKSLTNNNKAEKRSSSSDYSDIDANSPNPIPKPRRSRIMFTSK